MGRYFDITPIQANLIHDLICKAVYDSTQLSNEEHNFAMWVADNFIAVKSDAYVSIVAKD